MNVPPTMPCSFQETSWTITSLLTAAIEQRRSVHLLYEGEIRTVEPHCLGKGDGVEDVVHCTQILPQPSRENSRQTLRLSELFVRCP